MMNLFGTIKTGGAFDVKGKDGSTKKLISFTAVDALGNMLGCQMWPDDPQHAQLLSQISAARRHSVQCEIAGYSVRMRTYKDGRTEPQANFIVTNVQFPTQAGISPVLALTGTVKGGNVFPVTTKNGAVDLLSFTVVDEVGNTWPCQMWPDDPQHGQLAQVIASARRQPVQLEVVSMSLRMRKFKDGRPDAPQVNFVVSRVALPNLGVQVA